jgi:hypothetical protein
MTGLREAGTALQAAQAQAGHTSIESTAVICTWPMTGSPPSTGGRRRRSTCSCDPKSQCLQRRYAL